MYPSDQPILRGFVRRDSFVRKKIMHEQDKTTSMFELVEQWQQSGQSQKRFILEHDIKLATFGYWVKKYRQHHSGEIGFARVEPGHPMNSTNTARIEIELADGIVVRIF
jgi:hypothetical protein